VAFLAWSVALIGVVLVFLGLVLWAGRGFGALPVSFGRSVTGVVGLVIAPLVYLTFGALLAARMWHNAVGWLLLGCGVLLATMLPANLIVAMAHETLRTPEPFLVTIAWLRNAFATPGTAALLIIAVFLFPEGRLVSRRWSIGIAAAIAGASLLAVGTALNPEGMVTYPTLINPTALGSDLRSVVNAIYVAGVSLTLVAVVHAIVSLGVRYRSGDEVRRAQLRWILLATMVTALAAVPFLLTRYLIDVGNTLGELASLGVQLAMSAFPVAASVAISRYRLYDVDLLIGRTLVYVPLMAILGGLYTAAIAIFQRLFVATTGQTSDVAIVLTVLLVAAVFTPLRRALEGALEKRFPSAAARPVSSPSGAWSSVPLAKLHEIGPRDKVLCPVLNRPVALSQCLTCPKLLAITTSPVRAVACTGGPPAT
jgi:hypothetical protein